MTNKKVSIIGAGFSGMSLAHECLNLGLEVEIYEKSQQVGGLISSPTTPFGFYETAANAFLGTGYMEDFLKENQIAYVFASKQSKNRYIFRKKPRQWPLGIFESIGFLLHVVSSLMGGRRWLRPHDGESVESWGQRCLGHKGTEFLLRPGLQGIYAGDTTKMSAPLVIGPLFRRREAKAKRSLPMMSGAQGMGSVMTTLAESLQKRGVKIHFGQELKDFQNNPVAICTSASAAVGILNAVGTTAAKENAYLLEQIEMMPIVTATVFYKEPPQKYQGFGILFPLSLERRALGLLMTSLTFERALPSFTETWIFGGALDPGIQKLSDEDLKSLIRAERLQIFGDAGEELDCRITRWPKGLPHYSSDLERILGQLRPMNKIYLHGNYLGAIGLSRILESSKKLAAEIAKSE